MVKIIVIVVLVACLSLLIMPSISFAGTNEWTNTGPCGGNANDLAISPGFASDHTMFAGLNNGGLFRSTDAGANWAYLGFGYGAISSLAISPGFTADHTLFVGGVYGGFYKSTDGGTSWTQLWGAFDRPAISPNFTNDQTIFTFNFSNGIKKSTDGGANWTNINNGLPQYVNAVAVSTNFASDHTLFAATHEGVYRTTDAGANWSAANNGLTGLDMTKIVVSPQFAIDHTLIAGAYGGTFYRSTDGGDNWSPAFAGLAGETIEKIIFSPNFVSDQTLLADTWGGGIFKSSNAGADWTAQNSGLSGINILTSAISPAYLSDQTVFTATADGIYKSTDGAGHWSATISGLTATDIRSLALSPDFSSDHTLFAGTYGNGIYKSTDNGSNWSTVYSGQIGTTISSIVISPGFTSDHTLFASADGIIKSVDGGANWTPANTGITTYGTAKLAISPSYSTDHTVLVTISGGYTGGVFKSVDGGDHWTSIDSGLENGWRRYLQSIVISPNYASDQTTFTGSNYGVGVIKSSDGGGHWNVAYSSTGITSLAISPNYGTDKTVFAGAYSEAEYGLVKSTDGGITWNPIDNGMPANTFIYSLAVSPAYASDHTLFAGTYSGVYKSNDEGANWSAENTGLTTWVIPSLAASPNYPNDHLLFAGTTSGAAFSRTEALAPKKDYLWSWYDNLGGDNWVLMANPADAAQNLNFTLSISGAFKALPYAGVVIPRQTIAQSYANAVGGPVKATETSLPPGSGGVVSQRTLWPKGGNSLEEVLGTEASRLSDHFWWSWYDMVSPGFINWVMVSNPSDTETVHLVLRFTNQADGSPVIAEGDVAPGAVWLPTFSGKMGGPVELKAYLAGGSWPADARNVVASQRALTNYESAFNEVPGIPDSELSDHYIWTWYDQLSTRFSNWVLIANPSTTETVHATINFRNSINGAPVVAENDLAPGREWLPTFPGMMGGPVEVKAYLRGGSWPGDARKVIASQRSLAGPSFEEVPGYPYSALASDYHWTWYDEFSNGVTNWVLVANPSSSEKVHAVVTFVNQADGALVIAESNIAPGGEWTPNFHGKMGGPVEVKAYLAGGSWPADARNVMASQRVMWNRYFNEVLGTVLN